MPEGSLPVIERTFDGSDIAVDAMPGSGREALITFTSYEKSGGATSGAFLGTVTRLERPSIIFISKWNHWFNTIELSECIEVANRFLGLGTERLLIGASMGGHAAIRLADDLKATAVVAISPQFCIRSPLVPFETRWQNEARNVLYWDNGISQSKSNADIHVLFDNEDVKDSKHAHLISQNLNVNLIGLPNSGHSSARALADLQLLTALFRFGTSSASNRELANKIVQQYRDSQYLCPSASVILNTLKRLSPDARRAFMLRTGDQFRGVSASQKALSNFLENNHIELQQAQTLNKGRDRSFFSTLWSKISTS